MREGHGERVGAVARAHRRHVDHALDAVDLLLDRQRNVADDGGGAGAGIARGHLHGRRHDIGILRDRQPGERHEPEDDGQDGDDVGEDRPLDEELGDHGLSLRAAGAAAGAGAAGAAAGARRGARRPA